MAPEVVNLKPFRQALEALRRALSQPKDEYLRDSVIQRFEIDAGGLLERLEGRLS